MTKKILLTKKSVIASKNERKRIFAWESIFYVFNYGLPRVALQRSQ